MHAMKCEYCHHEGPDVALHADYKRPAENGQLPPWVPSCNIPGECWQREIENEKQEAIWQSRT